MEGSCKINGTKYDNGLCLWFNQDKSLKERGLPHGKKNLTQPVLNILVESHMR